MERGDLSDGHPAKVAAGDYGPVRAMTVRVERFALTSGLEHQLTWGAFYNADPSKALFLLADGS